MGGSNRQEGACCWVCKEARKPRLCPACAHTALASHHRLHQASLRHQRLSTQLHHLLHAQEGERRQQDELQSARERLVRAQALQKNLQTRRHQVIDDARCLRQEIARRRALLQKGEAQEELAGLRLARSQEQAIELQQMLSALVSGPLSTERRKGVGILMDILPLTTSQGSTNSKHRTVLISGCQLPLESAGPPLPGQQENTSTALGHIVSLLSMLRLLMDTPSLIQLNFQGSTSSLGEQHSFWATQHCKSHKLHLFHMEVPHTGSAMDTKPGATPSSWKHRLHWDSTFRSNVPPSLAREVTDYRQAAKYKTALLHLRREIGILVSGHQSFMLQDSFFASLSDFCWQVAMRPRSDTAGVASDIAASFIMRQPYCVTSVQSVVADRQSEEVDGWNLISRPFQSTTELSDSQMIVNMVMPPPPSDAEDVIKHWEKANFTTPSNYLAAYLSPQAISRHVNPLRQTASAAADRWLQRFRKF